MPATSTTQSRQAPVGERPSTWHSVGMRTPASRAACRRVLPFGTVTGRSLIFRVTVWVSMALSLPHSQCTAPKRQTWRQVSQRTHLSSST